MDTENFVYFELNNWFSGRDYPNEPPFTTWCGNDLNLYFLNEDWVKENKLVVVAMPVDMSMNWCVTAPKEWVVENCPKLLSDEVMISKVQRTGPDGTEIITEEHPYSNFLRFPEVDEEDGETINSDIYGRFGTKFLEYSEENIGIHWEPDYGYDDYDDEEEDEDEDDE